jgi:hypothetical protein
MYLRIFRHGTHIRQFTISTSTPSGWGVKDEQDGRILRNHMYSDWHRVERAKLTFAIEATRLLDEGWIQSTLQ